MSSGSCTSPLGETGAGGISLGKWVIYLDSADLRGRQLLGVKDSFAQALAWLASQGVDLALAGVSGLVEGSRTVIVDTHPGDVGNQHRRVYRIQLKDDL